MCYMRWGLNFVVRLNFVSSTQTSIREVQNNGEIQHLSLWGILYNFALKLVDKK